MKRYFITGTDTDCGKTYVTTQLLKCVQASVAIKPIASGCDEIRGELVSSDALQIQNNCSLSLDQINPWRFKSPISPHIAAQQQNIRLSAQQIADYCLNLESKDHQTLFIEGAGGLLVPLNETETWVDFLKLTQIPVVLVVGMKLGCINHALLTATVLKTNGICCAGWIANCIDPQMQVLSENIETLRNKMDFPLLSIIPYLGTIDLISSNF